MSDMRQFTATPTVEELEAEIERLREERDKWRSLSGSEFHGEYDLRKENAKLRAHLTQYGKNADYFVARIAKLQAVVDAALQEIKDGSLTNAERELLKARAALEGGDDG